jgi:uncharacterized membrane protein
MTTPQKALAVLVFGMVLVAGGVSWFFMRTKGLVDETLSLQTRLLAGELTGRDRRSGVMQVTRNIDKMDREDVKKVRDAFSAEWRRLQQQGVDDSFAADEADREALLDRDIDRLVTAGELWFATNPRSNGLAPKPRKPKKAAVKPGQAQVSPAAQLLDIYRTKLLARAGKRGVTIPDWLLGPR